MAASEAVSVRRTRLPSSTSVNPSFSVIWISSADNPPSEPISKRTPSGGICGY